MKINEILKPCPFCGSEVEIARLDMDQGGVTSIEIRCRCGAELRFESDDYIYDWTDTPHQMGLTAIEKFNNRVTDKSYTWRHYEGMIYCEKCGAEFYDNIMEYCGDDYPKYCPECGARMFEEVTE